MTNKEKANNLAEVGIVPQAGEVFGRKLPKFQERWQELAAIRQQQKEMEQRAKELTTELTELFSDSGHQKVVDGEIRVTLVAGSRANLNKQLLIENGVTADILEKSTKVSTFTGIKISRPGERDEE